MIAGRPESGAGVARPDLASGPGPEAGAPRPRVLLWFDYACPFCYLDWWRFKRVMAAHDVETVLVPFELRPTIPDEGVSAAASGLTHSEHVEEHMARIAAQEGVPFILGDHVPNTHRALLVGEAARDAGAANHVRYHEAAFLALYRDGLDLARTDVLVEVAAVAGLEEAAVSAAMSSERYEQRLHSFRHLAMAMGVDATPAALICNRLLVGVRPAEVIEEAIASCLAGPTTPVAPLADTAARTAAQ